MYIQFSPGACLQTPVDVLSTSIHDHMQHPSLGVQWLGAEPQPARYSTGRDSSLSVKPVILHTLIKLTIKPIKS